MAEVINLRRARKVRERDAAAQKAGENRAKFGRTSGQKAADEAERVQRERMLDQARRDPQD